MVEYFRRILGVSDNAEMLQISEKISYSDIFFRPEYTKLFSLTHGDTKDSFGGEGILYFFGNEKDYIIYPFLKRNIRELQFYQYLDDNIGEWFDIVSPYGYSGPTTFLSNLQNETILWQEFVCDFHKYCIENNIVSEFSRLHPFIDKHEVIQTLPGIEVQKRGVVVYIDLQKEVIDIKKDMSKGNKSSVSKAKKNGVTIVRSKNESDIDSFYRIYTETMNRNNAKTAYFFSKEFFHNAFTLLGNHVELFNAWYENRVISSSMFLFNSSFVHYYLSGSDNQYFALSPNNLLLYEVIQFAKEKGCKIFNLGGGYEQNDSLFRFKSSFSNSFTDFFTFTKIHDSRIYKILCQTRDRFDNFNNNEIKRTGYFPEYRR